jgi:hypothetical protein
MSAIVTSPEDEDWYTNSRSWSIILDRAMRDLTSTERDEFVKHAGPIGVNFRFVDEPERPRVARWLLRAVEALAGPEAAEHDWATDANRSHLEEVAVMLRRIAQG